MPANIHYTVGDATAPKTAGNKILVHICNDIGGWGKGFVLAISRRWKAPEAAFREWFASGEFALGEVQFVQVESDMCVGNLIGQHNVSRRGSKAAQPPIRYAAVRDGLKKVAIEAAARKASVHMPRIGCGLAGGKWEEIERIIDDTLISAGVEVFVYDLA